LSFSIGAMLVLALLVWQALGLPEVEDPIPEKIGLGSIVGLAGAFGILAGILSVIVRPLKRERFVGVGTLAGFCVGVGIYALSLFVQLISSP
jgi:hypothetical protein